MHDIKLTDIVIENRIREDLGDIDSLAFSIQANGLFHPILVEPRDDGRYTLIMGERRFRAYEKLERSTISCNFRQDLSEEDRLEMELEENLSRQDFTWQERARALSKLYKLKKNKHCKTPRFGSNAFTVKDAAEHLGISKGKVSEDLQLSAAMSSNPDIEKCLTRKEALVQIRRIKHGQLTTSDLGTLVTKYRECMRETTAVSLVDVPANSIDLLILDRSEKLSSVNKAMLTSIHRVLSPTGHCYLFFNMCTFPDVLEWKESALHFGDTPHIWHIRGEDDYLPFLWCAKSPSVEEPKQVQRHVSYKRDPEAIHSLDKPYGLLFHIVSNSTVKGAAVLDPICYGLNLAKVCFDTGRNVQLFVPNKTLYDQLLINAERKKK